jgi:hypothetical protein
MPAKQSSSAINTPKATPEKVRPAEDTAAFECYCGLGPACPMFREMSDAQRADCTRDKRQTAQWMYVNGMTE